MDANKFIALPNEFITNFNQDELIADYINNRNSNWLKYLENNKELIEKYNISEEKLMKRFFNEFSSNKHVINALKPTHTEEPICFMGIDLENKYPSTITNWFNENPCKNLEIPSGVEAIMSFDNNLARYINIKLPASLKYFGNLFHHYPVFEDNKGGKIYFTGTKEQWESAINSCPFRNMNDYTDYANIVEFVDEDFEMPEIDFHVSKNDKGEVIGHQIRYCSYAGEVTLPTLYIDKDSVEQKITDVGPISFAMNKDIKKVIIPAGINCICPSAFRDCENLEEVIFEESDEPIVISHHAFASCNNLKKVHLGRKAYIYELAFQKEGNKIDVESVQDLTDEDYVNPTAFTISHLC